MYATGVLLVTVLGLQFVQQILCQNALSSIPEGEPCRRNIDGRTGICLEINKCGVAKGALLRNAPMPVGRCGFKGDVAVVCCPHDVNKALQACNNYKKMAHPRVGKYISNGQDAEPFEFPHMVALGYMRRPARTKVVEWNCGGTLISDCFVLTAAHCLKVPGFKDPVFVRVGDHDLASTADDQHAFNYVVEEAIQHPRYTSNKINYNDIGLVKVRGRVKLGKSVMPACLYTSHNVAFDRLTVVGWGAKGPENVKIDNKEPRVLQKGDINVINLENCTKSYKDNVPSYMLRDTMPRGIIKSMVCGSDLSRTSGLVDACNGDSGGPLQYMRGDVFYVIGITSGGLSCPSSVPSIYTRVSRYVDWISFYVWP